MNYTFIPPKPNYSSNSAINQKDVLHRKQRAKMILGEMDRDPELMREFNLLLRQRKIDNIKKESNS